MWFNLKRYRYNGIAFQKINDRFEFSEHIDLAPYSTPQPNTKYTLYSVLVHTGELIHHGHYYCFINADGQWLKFDDRTVTKASHELVFQSNFGGTYSTGEFNQG
jgi:ubiquitin C-terminal hydrolase